jgi:hypothetical protein
MKRNNWLWGGVLIVAGVLLLAQNFRLFGAAEDVVWAAMFAVGSAAFLSVAVLYRAHWWAFIPGMVLLSLATIIGLQAGVPRSAELWSGSIMLGGIGLAFWLIYLTHAEHWWAIIPGGVLWTLATVAGLESVWAQPDGGGVFFAGLATTFALVYLLPTAGGRMRWALFPAAGCALLSVVTFAAVPWVLNYLWPAALIIAGVYVLFNAQRLRRMENTVDDARQATRGKEEGYDTPSVSQPH